MLLVSSNAVVGCSKPVDKADQNVPGLEMDEPPIGGADKPADAAK
jgi:hypothetical protein